MKTKKEEEKNDANGGRMMMNTNNYNPVSPNCIVLAPTRELASQIELEAQKLCFNQSICPVAVYGGASQQKQLRQLAFAGEGGSVLVVATPGRLVCLILHN